MMFWQKSKTMQYACGTVHFTIQNAYLWEGRECFSFCFKTNNTYKQQSWTSKTKTCNKFSKLISSFWKKMRRGRIYFPKRKTRSTPICKCTLFFQFSQNISKSNLKLPFFVILIEIVLNAWETKDHKGPKSL